MIYDIAIIGGGVAGIGLAAQLPASLQVVLLESEPQTGYHASGRSAALWTENYGSPLIRGLSQASRPWLVNPKKANSSLSLLTPREVLILAQDSPSNLAHLMQEEKKGHHVHFLNAPQIKALCPFINTDRYPFALKELRSGDIDTDAMLQLWLRQFKQKNGHLFTSTQVLSIRHHDTLWTLKSKDNEFKAKTVVNAAGAWADKIASLAGMPTKNLQALKRSIAVIDGLTASHHDQKTLPMLVDLEGKWYAKPQAGQWLVSPADASPCPAHDAFTDELTLAEGLYHFEQATHFEIKRISHSWAGLRTQSPDDNPVVGYELSEPEKSFFWLAAQSGYGMQTAPALSSLAAKLLIKDTLSEQEKNWKTQLCPARVM